MREFDFDELDRAVTSALGRSTNDTVPARSDDATPPPADTASRDQVAPRQTVPARRTSGRFMDVVHPSSDMRTATQPQPVSTPAAPTPEPEPQPEPEQPVANSTPPVIMPTLTAPASSSEEPEEETPPLQSPFIATNVEKRPLGAANPFSAASLSEADAITSAAQVSQSRASQDTPLPKELSDEILALDETPVSSEPQEAPAHSTPPPFAAPSSHPAATKNQTGGIYDTDSYHAPAKKASKKKTGLFIALWVLGLVVIGGGMGAAVYFFVLPML